jgi:hypothetical protein
MNSIIDDASSSGRASSSSTDWVTSSLMRAMPISCSSSPSFMKVMATTPAGRVSGMPSYSKSTPVASICS